MSKLKNLTDVVFSDIVGSSTHMSKYDEFINNIGEGDQKDLNVLKNKYRSLIDKHKEEFNKLATMEELILQMRSRDTIMSGSYNGIKLSLVREYIYARYPFYRKGMSTKDIRVIVDKSEFWGENLDVLYKNEVFMERARTKLEKAINVVINENILEYENLISN
jgi:hypothetical protein